ncbi:hypothetical protein [uncultured Friedmanniella sp.]
MRTFPSTATVLLGGTPTPTAGHLRAAHGVRTTGDAHGVRATVEAHGG